jgi:hypothetical protein
MKHTTPMNKLFPMLNSAVLDQAKTVSYPIWPVRGVSR